MLAKCKQQNTTTFPGRNGHYFEKLVPLVNSTAPRILSFGCSAGYEILDILKHFPNAKHVVGVDVCPEKLAEARKLLKPHVNVSIMHSIELEKCKGYFDLIISCHVLCNHNGDPKLPILPYKQYVDSIDQLIELCNPAGACLFVMGANYSIEDYPFPSTLDVNIVKVHAGTGTVPVFTSNGIKKPNACIQAVQISPKRTAN